MNMTKKMGPLPVWAWGLIFGVGLYFLYERSKSTSSSSSGALDPNAIDPNTGLTYGQEESAAENSAAAGTVPASGGLDSSGGTTGGTTGTAVSSADQFDQEIQSFLTAYSDLAQLQAALAPPAATSDTTDAAASSDPVTGSNPPTSPASAHTPNASIFRQDVGISESAQSILDQARGLAKAAGRRADPKATAKANQAAALLKQAGKETNPYKQRQQVSKARKLAAEARGGQAAAAKHPAKKPAPKRPTRHSTPPRHGNSGRSRVRGP